jgi:hypothetical protein
MSLNRTEYYASLEAYLPDNSNQLISPQDVRTVLVDLVESIPNFITDREISTTNIGSPEVRTTRVGDLSLNQLSVNPASYSEDNTALGYYSLAANYSGIRNTSVGSYALGCSLYGDENVSLGFFSSASNLTGSGNVALGNYTLRGNKHGDFNIAIGHGAGNNIDPTSNYRFYLGAAPINLSSSGQDFTHLMYGDLQNLKLAIAARSLHNYGTLQVSGTVSPTIDKIGNLGHPYMSWGEAYIASGIGYAEDRDFIISRATKPFPSQYDLVRMLTLTSGGKVGVGFLPPSGNLGFMTVDGDLIPSRDKVYSLGHPLLKWNGYFGNIIVSGTATINDLEYVTKTECLYECKTLHLATSGLCSDDIYSSTVCGYLSDEGIDGAGFEVHSSGVGYRRDYRFIYRFPDQTLSCLENDSNYSRSRWESNISIAVTNGNHIQTQRVLSKDNLSLVTESGCFGAFIRQNNQLIFGSTPLLSSGTDNVNFIFAKGFDISNIAHGSGLSIKQRFFSRNKTRGFELDYQDEKDEVQLWGQPSDRFSIRAIGMNRDAFTILRSGDGLVGIANINKNIPATIFNVQANSGCDARLTSYNLGQVSLQMLAQTNVPVSGFEILYQPKHPAKTALTDDMPSDNAVLVDFSIFSPSGSSFVKEGVISIAENNFVSLGTTRINNTRAFLPNSPLTIRHNSSLSGTIALAIQSVSPGATFGFGKIYIKKEGSYDTLFFKDGDGNESLITSVSGENLYVDNQGNTYGGKTPNNRPVGTGTNHNTVLGFRALNIGTTTSGNVAIGSFAANDIQTGSDNVFIGNMAGDSADNIVNNVVVGPKQFNNSVGGTGNIIIGNNNANQNHVLLKAILIGSGLTTESVNNEGTLKIGFGSNPLITGFTGGANGRKFEVRDGFLSVFSNLNDQEIRVVNNKRGSRNVSNFIVKDYINASVNDGLMSIRFADSNDFTRTLVDFDYNAPYYNPAVNFSNPSPTRPFVGISGDVRVLGAVRFADGTFLDTATLNAELNFYDLPDALSIATGFTTANSYMALSVPNSSGDHTVGRISLQSLADYVGSGFAAVSNNCNHIWSNVENQIDKTNNSNSVFIGCNVAVSATGWKNCVIIGSEAGFGATTPNVGLATDTSSIWIGNRAGYEADNTANQIAIGTNAGRNSVASSRSIYIGSNAGDSHNGSDCIGIGFHALRGSDASTENGTRNIEIVAGLLDNQRLMHASGNLSDRINIQNTIAGDTAKKRIAIGQTTLNPDAPLSVRRNSIAIPGHSENNFIQTWWCNGSRVAYIDCDGNFYGGGTGGGGSTSGVLEGVARNVINPPGSPASPTSGIVDIKDSSWNTFMSVWVLNRDTSLTVPSGAYVQVVQINGTYRFQWSSCGV